jgi:hypothetical protein
VSLEQKCTSETYVLQYMLRPHESKACLCLTERETVLTLTKIPQLVLFSASVPLRDDYRMIGDLSSHGNELVNGFLDRSRWVELLQEQTRKGGRDEEELQTWASIESSQSDSLQ